LVICGTITSSDLKLKSTAVTTKGKSSKTKGSDAVSLVLDYLEIDSRYRKYVKVVTSLWLMDSITNYTVLSPDHYRDIDYQP
jgi:hypothetical protein